MEVALSDKNIRHALHDDVNIVLYSKLSSLKNLDQLFNGYDCCALLYLAKKSYGHWTALIKDEPKNIVYYFDSFGETVDEPLTQLTSEQKRLCNEQRNYLSKLIYKSGYNCDFMAEPLQEDRPDIKTCGRWVIARCLLKNLTNTEFEDFFKKNPGDTFTPDEVVTEFTRPLLGF